MDENKHLHLRVFTAFSGYDSQCMALDRLVENYPWFSYELVGWSEIDEYAISSHNAVFPEAADKNLGDISKVDWKNVPDFDLFTYSSPCQDFSICGKQRGGEAGSGTRSSLLWECQRTIEEKRPKFCLLENVKNLYADKKFYPLLMSWKRIVDSYGYNSFIKVLNAADYDIPQGRERVFMVSIRKDEIDESPKYYFPKPIERKREIEDFLCDRVPEEYYLSDDVIPKFLDLLYNTGEDFDEKTTEHKHLIKDKEKEHNIDQYGVDEDSIELEEPDNTEAKLIETIGYVPVKNENALF